MISSDHLEPGQSGQIKATIDTTGRTGNLEKYITVYSNDRTTPVVTVSFRLEITERF